MVYFTHAGDGTDRVFLVLQDGRIIVFPNDEGVRGFTVFLDLRPQVKEGREEGLLGLSFDPHYQENRRFYVYYSAPGPRRSVISRFVTRQDDPNRADPASEKVLLEVLQPFSNHNGGMLAFGPDGYLYVGLGDGGSGGDPRGNGQNRETLLGALLRIDVSGDAGYAIPLDNPFVEQTRTQPEIWAYGLRNPWRFSFDRLSEALWLADVGQDAWEEINIITRGGNYGWNRVEGRQCYPSGGTGCNQEGLIAPIAVQLREAMSIGAPVSPISLGRTSTAISAAGASGASDMTNCTASPSRSS